VIAGRLPLGQAATSLWQRTVRNFCAAGLSVMDAPHALVPHRYVAQVYTGKLTCCHQHHLAVRQLYRVD
jgi:hypothetical protein